MIVVGRATRSTHSSGPCLARNAGIQVAVCVVVQTAPAVKPGSRLLSPAELPWRNLRITIVRFCPSGEAAVTEQPNTLEPVLKNLTHDQKITVLIAAYNKHATELGAIEASQQALSNLVLGIFSAALTLLIALYKDEPTLVQGQPGAFLGLSMLDWVMVIAAGLIMAYSHYMGSGRNRARLSVRKAVERIDYAFSFFQKGAFLAEAALYPDSFAPYAKTSFLQRGYWLIYLPATAFVMAVVVLSRN